MRLALVMAGCEVAINVSIPQKGLPPCGNHLLSLRGARKRQGFNTAKGSPPMRLCMPVLLCLLVQVSIPQKGLPPCGGRPRCVYVKVLVRFNTAKGSPPMRPSLTFSVFKNSGMFQYRKRVSPHAAMGIWVRKEGKDAFQYRKRVSPHAAKSGLQIVIRK